MNTSKKNIYIFSRYIFIFTFYLFLPTPSKASTQKEGAKLSKEKGNRKLIDSIAVSFGSGENMTVITLSQLKRMQDIIPIYNRFMPFYFSKPQMTIDELKDVLKKVFIVRGELQKLGFQVSRTEVESELKNFSSSNNMPYDQFLSYFRNQGVSSAEIEEVMQYTLEFQRYNYIVVRNSIHINDSEILAEYLKENPKSAKSLQFDAVDFIITKEQWSDLNQDLRNGTALKKLILKYLENSSTESPVTSIFQQTHLDGISSDDFKSEISNALKTSSPKDLLGPFELGEHYHFIFVKDVRMSESSDFLRNKEAISIRLLELKTKTIFENLIEEQANQYSLFIDS